tara:strand:- start:2814 stop:3077 length:264 start_codon:yes stop_codon:yes gene_type:complete
MDKKEPFGQISANELEVGDIVEWKKWNSESHDWDAFYGIMTEIKNEVKGNRLISVSVVMPLAGPQVEIEFFTPSLRLVSKAEAFEKQ